MRIKNKTNFIKKMKESNVCTINNSTFSKLTFGFTNKHQDVCLHKDLIKIVKYSIIFRRTVYQRSVKTPRTLIFSVCRVT